MIRRVRSPDEPGKRVEPLPKLVPLQSVLPALGKGDPNLAVPVGLNDLDREPMRAEFLAKGPHWIVIGPPVTGKSTVLRSLVLSLAHGYTPDQVAMVLVDPSALVVLFVAGSCWRAGRRTMDELILSASSGDQRRVTQSRSGQRRRAVRRRRRPTAGAQDHRGADVPRDGNRAVPRRGDPRRSWTCGGGLLRLGIAAHRHSPTCWRRPGAGSSTSTSRSGSWRC
jgi:hypothetical protein